MQHFKIEKLFVPVLVLVHLILAVDLIADVRVPIGHDGFQYFSLQYYFLNNYLQSGEIAQWMPFMTHGTVATWWYAIQAGFLQSALLLIGKILPLQQIGFLPVYHLGMFCDEMVLLAGVWLMGRRYFVSPLTCFYVASTILATSVWMMQPWYNFHFYYAIPLMLHFFHRHFESGNWIYFFLGVNLFAVQSLANLPYFIPVVFLVLAVYFGGYFLVFRSDFRVYLTKLRPWRIASLAWLAASAASMGILYSLLTAETGEIVNYNYGRNLDGTTDIHNFLTYGTSNLFKWIELVLRIAPASDYGLYLGGLTLFLILFSVCYLNRRSVHLGLVILILLNVSAGSVLAYLAYAGMPMMKYYRHLSLISPIIKIFVCFFAGFGLDALLTQKLEGWRSRFLKIGILAVVLGSVFLAFDFLSSVENIKEWLVLMMTKKGMLPLYKFNITYAGLARAVGLTLAMVVFSGVVLVILINGSLHRSRLVLLLVVLHFFDVYSYRNYEQMTRSMTVAPENRFLMNFEPMPFAHYRRAEPGRRERAFLDADFYNTLYWSTDSFLFKDDLGNKYRTDHWLKSLDRLVKTYEGRPLDDVKKPEGLVSFVRWEFPDRHPAVLKVTGVTEPKIGFFRTAYAFDDPGIISDHLASESFSGDVLFVEGTPNGRSVDVSADERVPFGFDIIRFSANRLSLALHESSQDPLWLVYADAAHPAWRAWVNGREAEIYTANLAYKALLLEPGARTVELVFQVSRQHWLQRLFQLNSLCWLAGIFVILYRLTIKERTESAP